MKSPKLLSLPSDVIYVSLAAVFMATAGGIYMVMLPFIIEYLGGSDKDLGLCSTLNLGAYVIACFFCHRHVDRYCPKIVAITGLTMMAMVASLLWSVILINESGYQLPYPIIIIMIIASLFGVAMSMTWAPMMGWISMGHEGKELTRIFAFYNISWSSGLVIGPYVGGLMVEKDYSLPALAYVLLMIAALISTTMARSPKPIAGEETGPANIELDEEDLSYLLDKFRMMAKIAMITIFVCIGLLRTQLAMLFVSELGFTKYQFGISMTILCLTGTLLFLIITKTHAWHYKLWPFMLSQVLTMLAILAILKTETLWVFYVIVGIIGIMHAFIYMSHQFYIVTGTARRSAAMLAHEIMIAIGCMIGYLAGGYLAEYFGRTVAPYLFAFIIVAIGVIIQLTIWFFMQTKKTIKEKE